MRLPKSFFGKHSRDAKQGGGGRTPPRRVGIVGTFDVENYGDLLFPLVAQAALDQRLESVDVVPFSPNQRSASAWPYDVHTTLDLLDSLSSLSTLLIGGGQIIRFDTDYPVLTDPRVRLPIDYWLTPAVLGALAGKPVIWNAVGAWTDSPTAAGFGDVVNATLAASHFVGLRDEASREHLAALAPAADLRILPDTVFSIARLWPLERESPDFVAWRESLRIHGSYVVVQADPRFVSRGAAIDAVVTGLGVETVVLLPVCRCHGDESHGLQATSGGHTARSEWPAPKLLSEIIGRAEAVVASSLHACITAISYGVPAVRVPSFNARDRKFAMLEEFEGVATIDEPARVAAVLARGKKLEARAIAVADRLEAYWDSVADVIMQPQRHDANRSMSTMLRWAAAALWAVGNSEPGIPVPRNKENASRGVADPCLREERAHDTAKLWIRVHRDTGGMPNTRDISPAAFDEFSFADGDRLEVLPADLAAQLPVTWGDRHIEVEAGRAIRVPAEYRLCEFQGFCIPSHLVSLTGAGPETLDLIGRAHIRNFSRHIGFFPQMTLVDLGCGIGRDAFQLLEYFEGDGRYVGVDVTRDSIEWCRRQITPRHPRFTFHHVDAVNELYNPFGRQQTVDFRLPLADASVDRITLASVFTHLLEDEVVHYMREFRRVLKPDGLVYATFFLHSPEALEAARTTGTTPWTATFEHALGEGVYGNDPVYPRGAVAYTDAAMRRMMQQAGVATDRPYVKGSWSGLHAGQAEDGQDAVILRRL